MADGLARWEYVATRLRLTGMRRWCFAGGVLPCLIVAAIMAVGLAAAAPAFADSASLTVTNTAGESDPAADLPRVFTVSGATAAPERVFVKTRAVGGAPCAPSADSDTGERVEEGFSTLAWETEVNGAFSISKVISWGSPGPALFCIWIASTRESITTPIPQVITFRSPSGTIAATISPPVPKPGENATLTVLGTSEAPEEAFAKLRPAGGAACAPDFSADPGTSLLDYSNAVNGAYQLKSTFSEAAAGSYVICLWLASSSSSIPAVAGPQPIPFTVGYPPPPPPPPPPPAPCVVPRVGARTRLTTIERQIRAAHCRVGRIHYARARRVKRGYVIGVSPHPRSLLSHGAAVSVIVSLGHRRH